MAVSLREVATACASRTRRRTYACGCGRGVQSRLPLGTPVDEPGPVAELLDRIAAWAPYRALATHHLWEDLFWRHACEPVAWLAPPIRL
jgi:hypothetical protein